ncbi:MAG TPA: pentapeptide repeat-containing protein [Actinocrinis sp.]|nr:pentapeptide repeat-containing protein [Actinocrinis sp.]
MAERRLGQSAPKTLTQIRDEDWYARDLSDQNHAQVEFIDLDLTETTGHGASFTDCTFRGVRFNVTTQTGAAFTNCTFKRCVFFEAAFTECKFVGSMFDQCTHDLMKVEGGDWSFTGLPGADLRSAAFQDVRMRETDLTGARFEGAKLRGCDLSGAWLHNTVLTGCDLRGSDLSALDPSTVELRGALVTMDQAVVIATALGLDVRYD